MAPGRGGALAGRGKTRRGPSGGSRCQTRELDRAGGRRSDGHRGAGRRRHPPCHLVRLGGGAGASTAQTAAAFRDNPPPCPDQAGVEATGRCRLERGPGPRNRGCRPGPIPVARPPGRAACGVGGGGHGAARRPGGPARLDVARREGPGAVGVVAGSVPPGGHPRFGFRWAIVLSQSGRRGPAGRVEPVVPLQRHVSQRVDDHAILGGL